MPRTSRTHACLLAAVCIVAFATITSADEWDASKGNTFKLEDTCPGNLLVNGGFETPDTRGPTPKAPWNTYNSRWGWYQSIPGWSWQCLKVGWAPKVLEMQHGAVATAPEGSQNLELLPNATGVACQSVTVVPGAKYRLTFYYGRLQTYAWRNEYKGQFVKFETTIDVLYRDAARPAPAEGDRKSVGDYPNDRQGFTYLLTADTRKQAGQWQKYEAYLTGPPSGKLQIAFTTTLRPKECGSCGSLLDAVCLQKV